MIEIVIKMDEKDYKRIQNIPDISKSLAPRTYSAIRNGTPLPKGHGRLKDIYKIEWYGCTTEFDCPHKDQECKNCNRAECSKTQVDAIPTIIEADKEVSNADSD